MSGPVQSQPQPHQRSLVRIKAAVLFVLFVGCWLSLLRNPSWHEITLLVVAGVAAVLFYFVRCERCHTSIYYRAGGTRVLFQGRSSLLVLASKKCPSCGLERI